MGLSYFPLGWQGTGGSRASAVTAKAASCYGEGRQGFRQGSLGDRLAMASDRAQGYHGQGDRDKGCQGEVRQSQGGQCDQSGGDRAGRPGAWRKPAHKECHERLFGISSVRERRNQ